LILLVIIIKKELNCKIYIQNERRDQQTKDIYSIREH
jgi:hypothetical protein